MLEANMDAEISELKGTKNLLLQVIGIILLISMCFVKHTSYSDTLHTHAYTHRL
jgi:hypothetical protein